MIMKSDVEVGQFQNQSPEYLPLSEDFWKALVMLPVVYDYAAYRNVLERFGTHYISEGTIGGHFKLYLMASEDVISKLSKCRTYPFHFRKGFVILNLANDCSFITFYTEYEKRDYKACTVTSHSVMFFIRWSTTSCKTDTIDKSEPFCKLYRSNLISTDACF